MSRLLASMSPMPSCYFSTNKRSHFWTSTWHASSKGMFARGNSLTSGMIHGFKPPGIGLSRKQNQSRRIGPRWILPQRNAHRDGLVAAIAPSTRDVILVSNPETQIGRYKVVTGPELQSLNLETQTTETQIAVKAMNRMTDTGRAVYVRPI